jgi:hypothetical protein
MITAVVDGIKMITLPGTVDGTWDPGITTGDCGSVGTRMYYDDGTFGMEFGVTNGVVNLIVYDGDGKVY